MQTQTIEKKEASHLPCTNIVLLFLLSRWMTNQLVQLSGRVLFLDLDPGQKEFGLPGYLTATIVDSPLLGAFVCVFLYLKIIFNVPWIPKRCDNNSSCIFSKINIAIFFRPHSDIRS